MSDSHICIATSADLPLAASPPVSAMPKPIRIGSCCAWAESGNSSNANTASAAMRNRDTRGWTLFVMGHFLQAPVFLYPMLNRGGRARTLRAAELQPIMDTDIVIRQERDCAMRFVTFRRGSQVSAGLLIDGDRVVDLGEVQGLEAKTALDVVLAGEAGVAAARETAKHANAGNTLALSAVKLMAPIPHPRKNVFCVGRNYVEHVAEGYRARGTEMKLPEFPQFFSKPQTAIIGPDDEVPYDTQVTQKLDYEVELGVIIGTRGKNI